jgi:hypothetical protein
MLEVTALRSHNFATLDDAIAHARIASSTGKYTKHQRSGTK